MEHDEGPAECGVGRIETTTQWPVRHQSGIWGTFCRESSERRFYTCHDRSTKRPTLGSRHWIVTHFIQLRVICFFHSSVYFLLPPLPTLSIPSRKYFQPSGGVGRGGGTQWRNLTTSPDNNGTNFLQFRAAWYKHNPMRGAAMHRQNTVYSYIYRNDKPLDRNMKSVSLAVRPARGSLNVKIKWSPRAAIIFILPEITFLNEWMTVFILKIFSKI